MGRTNQSLRLKILSLTKQMAEGTWVAPPPGSEMVVAAMEEDGSETVVSEASMEAKAEAKEEKDEEEEKVNMRANSPRVNSPRAVAGPSSAHDTPQPARVTQQPASDEEAAAAQRRWNALVDVAVHAEPLTTQGGASAPNRLCTQTTMPFSIPSLLN